MKESAMTVYDIAAALGLSPATVSRALNHPEQVAPATREKVLSFANASGFRKRDYNSSARIGFSDAVGGIPGGPGEGFAARGGFSGAQKKPVGTDYLICIPSPGNPFYSDIVEGALGAAAQHECRLYADYSPLTAQNIEFYLQAAARRFSGIITLHHIEPAVLRRIKSALPVVQCSEHSPDCPEISSVSIDDVETELRAAEYLLSIGRREIAFMTAMSEYRFALERLTGFRLALERADAAFPESRILRVPQIEFSLALDAALKFLPASCPDAIVCISDVFAAACVKAACELHIRVPDELMIVGFDNIPLSRMTTPSITTIHQPKFKLGYNAFEILYREAHEPSAAPQHVVLPTELILRESTAERAAP